ncbi:hypothetical protein V8F20_009822 [Naviculisporaceae sp. PSN 640]
MPLHRPLDPSTYHRAGYFTREKESLLPPEPPTSSRSMCIFCGDSQKVANTISLILFLLAFMGRIPFINSDFSTVIRSWLFFVAGIFTATTQIRHCLNPPRHWGRWTEERLMLSLTILCTSLILALQMPLALMPHLFGASKAYEVQWV